MACIFIDYLLLNCLAVALLFTLVLFGCLSLLQLFLLRILVPREETILDCTADQLFRLLLHQVLLVLEVILCQFRVFSLTLLPHLL